MRKIQLLLILSALIGTGFQSLQSATSACPAPSLDSVMHATGNCGQPTMPAEISARTGIAEVNVRACLKVLKESNAVVRLTTGEYCCQSG